MRSAPPVVARRAQGPQPVHDVSDPRFHDFRILSILCQRAVTFDHRNQKSSCLSRFQVAADPSMLLSISHSSGNAFLPVTKYSCEPFAESFMKRRHLLRQIEQGTATPYGLGPN